MALAAQLHPDVVLMDIRMPVMDGIAATRTIVADAGAAIRILILTTFDLDEYVYEALLAGASGFLLKDTPPTQLVEAVRVVAAGDALLAPTVTRRLIQHFVASGAALPERVSGVAATGAAPPPGDLTARETEVFRLLARGFSNAVIAEHLSISDTTVKSHVAHVLMKLGLHDRVQAVVAAYETGFVRPGDDGGG